MAADPQNEAATRAGEWWLVEPPNTLHHVAGRAQLDALARGKQLDVGNLHQLCVVTLGPREKPLLSVHPPLL